MFSTIGNEPSKPLKIIPATHVTADSGTGLVHCAPGHGAEDYNAFRALGLLSSGQPITCHVGEGGKFTPGVVSVVGEAAGEKLVGQEVLQDGSKAVVELLKELGCLVKIKRIKHRYPYDWKTDQPIIVTCVSSSSCYLIFLMNLAVPLRSGSRTWMTSRVVL